MCKAVPSGKRVPPEDVWEQCDRGGGNCWGARVALGWERPSPLPINSEALITSLNYLTAPPQAGHTHASCPSFLLSMVIFKTVLLSQVPPIKLTPIILAADICPCASWGVGAAYVRLTHVHAAGSGSLSTGLLGVGVCVRHLALEEPSLSVGRDSP